MIWRLLAAGLLGVLAATFEVGAAPFFPSWVAMWPVIPVLVLLLVSTSKSRVYACAIGAAFVLDAYTLDRFDLALIRLPVLVLVLSVLADRFLTNRSVYATVALVVSARILDWVGSWVISFVAATLNQYEPLWSFPSAPLLILTWDVVMTAFMFLVIASFTGRFLMRPGSSYAQR